MIGRVEVGGSRGKGEGRQVGQFERSLFCTEGPVNGMRGKLFTVISILRVVCRGGILSSRRGRVAHLRASATDDKALVTLSISLSFSSTTTSTPATMALFALVFMITPYYFLFIYLISVVSSLNCVILISPLSNPIALSVYFIRADPHLIVSPSLHLTISLDVLFRLVALTEVQ